MARYRRFKRRFRRGFRRAWGSARVRGRSSLILPKFWDSTGNSANTPYPIIYAPTLIAQFASLQSTWWCINTVVDGTGMQARVGDIIRVKKIHLRMHIASGTAFSCCRLLIIQDNNPSQVPTMSQIFQNAPVLGQYTVMSYNNRFYRSRFRVLFNRIFCVADNSNNPQGFRMVDVNLKCNVVTQFVSSTQPVGDISDIAQGSLYVLLFSDQPGTSTAPKMMDSYCRITYNDN